MEEALINRKIVHYNLDSDEFERTFGWAYKRDGLISVGLYLVGLHLGAYIWGAYIWRTYIWGASQWLKYNVSKRADI